MITTSVLNVLSQKLRKKQIDKSSDRAVMDNGSGNQDGDPNYFEVDKETAAFNIF